MPPTDKKLNSFGKITYDWPSEELFRAAEQIQELLEHSGWAVIQRVLAEYEQVEQTQLLNVITSNQAAAARFAGRIEGVKASKVAAHGVLAAAQRKRAELEERAAREVAERQTA